MRCGYCERRCRVSPGRTGFCRMYMRQGDTVIERFPHHFSACGTSRIESFPFYHVYPGSRSMAIGTSSCNFQCRYCSNAYIAKEDPEVMQGHMYRMSPEKLIDTARKLNCHNIVFSVNEPTVSIPTLLEVAQAARSAGIPMGCLTNGFATKESIELLASIFSFFNVSLKGLSSQFTRRYIGIDSSQPVLRNIRRLAQDRHVEVTTPVIQGANDIEIDGIAEFLAGVDPEIPWHVFRLLPEDEMKDAPYPDIGAIDHALQSARKKLHYVYFHNFVGSAWVNTLCPACGSVVIERFSLGCGGDKLKHLFCQGKACPHCGQEIRIETGKPHETLVESRA
ncbi:MAG TPA: radical SAM protein [Syntrophorhabdus aromaticivorans]|nr:radical SAM protein [Syntrophorhabdus aromaticivorans]